MLLDWRARRRDGGFYAQRPWLPALVSAAAPRRQCIVMPEPLTALLAASVLHGAGGTLFAAAVLLVA